MNYDDLLANFKEWIVNDPQAQALWKKATEKRANYYDATRYAEHIGAKWSRLLSQYTDDYIEHLDDIEKSLLKAYSESAYYTKNVQTALNENAGIGMKALEPHINDNRVVNLIDKLATDNASWLLDSDVISNLSRSAVSDTVQANARIQAKAGLPSYIERDTGAGCCEWCESIAGRYEYGKQPSNFFAVHKDCTCTITFMPTKSKWQKITYGNNSGRTTKVTTDL